MIACVQIAQTSVRKCVDEDLQALLFWLPYLGVPLQNWYLKCGGIFAGGSVVSCSCAYRYHQSLYCKDLPSTCCPTMRYTTYSVVVSLTSGSWAPLGLKRGFLEKWIVAVSFPGASVSVLRGIVLYMPFWSVTSVRSLTLIFGKGPIVFGIGFIHLFVAIYLPSFTKEAVDGGWSMYTSFSGASTVVLLRCFSWSRLYWFWADTSLVFTCARKG